MNRQFTNFSIAIYRILYKQNEHFLINDKKILQLWWIDLVFQKYKIFNTIE